MAMTVRVLGLEYEVRNRSGVFVMAAFLACASLLCLTAAATVYTEAKLLALEAAQTEAVVIAKSKSETRKRTGYKGGSRRSTRYHLKYAFSAPGTERIELSEVVLRPEYDAAAIGDVRVIWYAPSHPRVFEFEKGGKAREARLILGMGVGLALVALGLACWGKYIRKMG